MMSNNSMTVITSKPFGSLNVDVYEDSKHEYYMTREQIGTALEYEKPLERIGKIHQRNADRLDPLSTLVSLTKVEGNRTVERKIVCYNLRGVMEICRLSRQPKADKFIDFCWDVIEGLMRGDSVLASPKMDAALTPDFIQAQFVALMEKQADLDKKMKYLNDRMGRVFDKVEDTRGLVNETLATVSSVSTAVHQIKDKQADDSIRAKSYTPRREPISDWRRDMYDKIKVAAKSGDVQTSDVLKNIYIYMRDKYGFVADAETKKYKEKTGRIYNVSTIEVIEDNEMYKSIFGSIVKDLYAEVVNKKKENFFDQPKAIDAAPEVNVNTAPVIEVEAKEVDTKESVHANGVETLTSIVKPIAEKMKDTSCNYQVTYRRIYRIIGFNRMSRMEQKYSEDKGRKAFPKTKLFIENEKNMKIFKNAARILNERVGKGEN